MERHKPADFSLDLTGILLQTNLVSYRGVPFELTEESPYLSCTFGLFAAKAFGLSSRNARESDFRT